MGTAHIRVEIDGQALYDFSKDVLMEQVDVVQEINQHWWCYIRCRQTEDQRFPIEDSLGKDLKVIAFDAEDTQTYLFSGLVLEAELEYEIYGSYTARITGVSKSFNMDVAPRQKYYDFGKNTIPNVASETTSRAGLSIGGDPGPGDFPMPLVQWGETDFNFLIRQMDDAVRWIFPDAEKGEVLNARSQFDDGPTLQWRVEDQLVSFKLRGKLRTPKMDGSHYNPLQGLSKAYTDVVGGPTFLDGASEMSGKVKEQSEAKLKPGYVTNRRGALELDHYQVLLQKEVNRSIETGVIATGISLNPAVAAGKKVVVQGVPHAEGSYGVTKVAHRWTPEGYSNEFWCTASNEYRSDERPKSNAWYGVVVARVADNNDPEKLGRLKVQYIWQEQGQTFWARFMTPHAGGDRGFLFIPEIGDEVVVAFEDGDAERPIVLGCLWNKFDKPSTQDFWSEEYSNDDVKRIVTKSGHRIQMVDKNGKESIVIATPTHLKIAMMESSDENGRPTMLLHSDGDIVINATGRIHCKSAVFSREVG
jgi:type VI secretion system secreted protein VgrG